MKMFWIYLPICVLALTYSHETWIIRTRVQIEASTLSFLHRVRSSVIPEGIIKAFGPGSTLSKSDF